MEELLSLLESEIIHMRDVEQKLTGQIAELSDQLRTVKAKREKYEQIFARFGLSGDDTVYRRGRMTRNTSEQVWDTIVNLLSDGHTWRVRSIHEGVERRLGIKLNYTTLQYMLRKHPDQLENCDRGYFRLRSAGDAENEEGADTRDSE